MRVIKGIVFATLLLAIGNFGLEIYLRHNATNNVIISAYREHAIAACRQNGGMAVNQAAWSQPSEVRLSIGKSELDVYLWQTNHRLWNARYRNAYIYVTIDDARSHIYCEYDITNDMAWVYQLGRDAPHQPYQRQG